MSLDFYLTISVDTGGSEPYTQTLFDANITHNVVPMWDKAGVTDALYESHDKQAKDIIDALECGVAAMEADPAGYEALNPPNGWGSYERALPWLRNVLAQCKAHPNATIGISR